MYRLIRSNLFVVVLFIIITVVVFSEIMKSAKNRKDDFLTKEESDSTWVAPSLYFDHTTEGREREMVIYGEELIAHTSQYLGPGGSVLQISNGMNCQNCHLDAGKAAWGNNYGAVYSTYPKFRERSGTTESIYKRVNDCFERSLNGSALDSNSKEMQAIYAYMKWLGQDVDNGEKPHGSGLEKLPYLNRAAEPEKGRIIYLNRCQSCHGADGEGQTLDGSSFATPPLWGKNSYNDGAGLYRLSNFASFVKNNMPFNQSTHKNPVLSNEEAWDVAAYVNSQQRPHKDQSKDWPDISKKPIDFPFGPYADTFPQRQHKFGPFGLIEGWRIAQQQKFKKPVKLQGRD
jgi:thiosulfate dehydrogenase